MFARILALIVALALVAGQQAVFAQETPTAEPTETPVPTDTPLPTDTPPPEPTETPVPTATDEPAAPSPTPEEDEDAAGDDDGFPWALVILGVVAALLFGTLLALLVARRGGPGPGALWRSRATDVYGRAAAVHDAIAVEIATSSPATDEPRARQRWEDVQRRLDDLAGELHALGANTPSAQTAAAVNRLVASLHALRSVITTDISPDVAAREPSDQLAALLNQRLAAFDADVRALREYL